MGDWKSIFHSANISAIMITSMTSWPQLLCFIFYHSSILISVDLWPWPKYGHRHCACQENSSGTNILIKIHQTANDTLEVHLSWQHFVKRIVFMLWFMLVFNSLAPGRFQFNFRYRQVSNIRCTKSQYLKDSRTVLWLSLRNPLKSDIKLRIKT